MVNYEFILAGNNNNIDIDMVSKLDNEELLNVVKAKVESYHTEGDANTKSSFLDNISFYAKEIGFEHTVDLLLPLFKKIVKENDAVKIKFLQNVYKLCLFLNSCKGYSIIRDEILPIVSWFFTYKTNTKIVELACDAFILLAELIVEEDKGLHVLNTVICK